MWVRDKWFYHRNWCYSGTARMWIRDVGRNPNDFEYFIGLARGAQNEVPKKRSHYSSTPWLFSLIQNHHKVNKDHVHLDYWRIQIILTKSGESTTFLKSENHYLPWMDEHRDWSISERDARWGSAVCRNLLICRSIPLPRTILMGKISRWIDKVSARSISHE
jgi:hypothetical protein